MKRREFISLLGSAAAWPLAAGAQQPAEMRNGMATPTGFIALLQFVDNSESMCARSSIIGQMDAFAVVDMVAIANAEVIKRHGYTCCCL